MVSATLPVSHPDTTLIGIDPGAKGAIAVMRQGRLLDVFDMPADKVRVGRSERPRVSATGIAAFFSALAGNPLIVWIENVNGGSRDGGGAAFVFGRSVGALDGVLAAYGIKPHYVHPTVWKRRAGLTGEAKDASVARAETLFPEQAGKFRGPRGGGIDGRAEAALIARHGALELAAS